MVEPPVGSTLHGVTSGAQSEVGFVVIESGTWAGNDAAGYVVLFCLSGEFIDDEVINFTDVGDGFGSGYSDGFG